MKKIIFISFFLLIFSGCYINLNNADNPKLQPTEFKNYSQSGKYLSANYSILKGDVFSANKILKLGKNNLTLLELQLFSNNFPLVPTKGLPSLSSSDSGVPSTIKISELVLPS